MWHEKQRGKRTLSGSVDPRFEGTRRSGRLPVVQRAEHDTSEAAAAGNVIGMVPRRKLAELLDLSAAGSYTFQHGSYIESEAGPRPILILGVHS